MNWLDLTIIGIIAWLTFSAYSAGILRETITVASVIAGAVVAGLLYKQLASDLLPFIESTNTARIAAFLTIFSSLALSGQLAGYLLRETAELLMLGWADRLAGAAFGIVKGLVLAELFFVFFTTYTVPQLEDAMADSRIAPFFLDLVPVLLRVLPSEFRDTVESVPL